MTFPLIPGDAAVGTVVAVGAALDATWHGTPVFVGTAQTPDGINAVRGVQQSWLVAPMDAAVRVDGLEPERALLLAPVGLALHNLARAGMAAGARLAILGQGVLGQTVARVARSRGAAHIVVADASAYRLSLAVADQAVLVSVISSAVPAKDMPDIDLLVDTTGDAALVYAWSARVRPGGTLLLLGGYSRLDLAYLHDSPGGLGILLAAEPGGGAYVAARDMLSGDDFDTTGRISHRFRTDHIAQAYAVALGDPDALQVVVAWQ
jgi:2-desacetyl-2-hydroxyethyl bacteriochlorophyllide A dehydrogenase